MNKVTRILRQTRLLVGIFIATLSADSCTPARQPIDFISVVDLSDQSLPRLLKYADMAYRTQARQQASDRFTVYIYSKSVLLVQADGDRTTSRAQFNRRVAQHFQAHRPEFYARETRTDLALDMVAERISKATRPTAVLFLTDGGVENFSGTAWTSIANSLAELKSSNNLLKIVFAGLLPEHHEVWREQTESLAGKCQTFGLDDYQLDCLDLEVQK